MNGAGFFFWVATCIQTNLTTLKVYFNLTLIYKTEHLQANKLDS